MRQRVAVLHERRIERRPVGGGEDALGEGQHLDLLEADVFEVRRHVVVHTSFEARAPCVGVFGVAHHLEREQVVLELEHGAMALRMLGVEAVEHGERSAALTHLREQQLALLGVVNLLREFVDVEEHRAKHREVGLDAVAPALREQQTDRPQHRSEHSVLVADDAQGGMHRSPPLLARRRRGGRCRAVGVHARVLSNTVCRTSWRSLPGASRTSRSAARRAVGCRSEASPS